MAEDEKCLSAEKLSRVHGRPVITARTGTDEWVLRSLLDHGLHELGCTSWEEHPVMLSEPTAADVSVRRHTAEFMFEELMVPALCVARSAELVAVSVGQTTAVILEMGGDASTAAVVNDGAVVMRSVQKSRLGGVILARMLAKTVARHPQLVGVGLLPACQLRPPIPPSSYTPPGPHPYNPQGRGEDSRAGGE